MKRSMAVIAGMALLACGWTKCMADGGNDPDTKAPAVDAKKILAAADAARGKGTGKAWTVTIVAVDGDSTDKKVLEVKAQDRNCLAKFVEPANEKGQMLLMKEQNMWYIKPGLSRPISISPRQRLMGGASNADIASTDYEEDYDAVVSGEEDVNGKTCYIMDLKGKTTKVSYDKIKYWVSKDNNLGLKAEFMSVSGKILKTATFDYETQDGKSFVSKMTIQDAVNNKSITTITYSKMNIGDIPASEFSLESLM